MIDQEQKLKIKFDRDDWEEGTQFLNEFSNHFKNFLVSFWFWSVFTAEKLNCDLDESENSRWKGVSHSFLATFLELFDELFEDFPNDTGIGILDLEDNFGDLNLFILKYGISDIFVVSLLFKNRVNKDQKLFHNRVISDGNATLHNSLRDLLSNFSSFFEPKILEQSWILVHGQNHITKCIQRIDQELADVNLTIVINGWLVFGTVVCCILQDFIDILVFGWVAFKCELKEGAVKIERVLDLWRVGVLYQFLNIYLEQTVNVASVLNCLNVQVVISQVAWKTIHQSDKDSLHVNLLFAFFWASIEQLWQGIYVEFLRETLNHTVQ